MVRYTAWGCITVLQCGIRHVTTPFFDVCLCIICAVPNAECHPAPLRDTVGCIPDDIGLVTCPDLAPDFASGFTRHPLDLMTLFRVFSANRGFSASFIQP